MDTDASGLSRLKPDRPSGVLNLRAGSEWFDSARYRPAPELAEVVEHYWTVRWDVRGREPYTQHTLSNAAVHLVVERGCSRIQGVVTGRFTRVLEGAGRIFGVKFRPAAFRAFLGSPVSVLTDRTVPIAEVFRAAGDELAAGVLALEDELRMVELADAFVRDRPPPTDPVAQALNAVVALIVADRRITRVDDLVERVGVGKRTLQRLFSEYVGVSPKWVIQRYRLHEAEERLAEEGGKSLAALAQELGYFDQAHFAHDFKAIVGSAPARYARDAGPPRTAATSR